MVIPLLDYCSQLWNPSQKGEIQSLEEIQRAFTRKIDGLKDLSYWERLEKLSLYSLERRRERYGALYCWKIINNQAPNVNQKIQTKYNSRRGRLCLIPPLAKTASARIKSLRENSFSVRGQKLFNILPKDTRSHDVT